MLQIIVSLQLLIAIVQSTPNINLTPQAPLFFFPGDDALIDCLIKNLENYTVVWKYANGVNDLENAKTLTINKARVVHDLRVSVLHRTGHDVWILKIKNVLFSDSGVYICEVHSDPIVQISRFVTIGYSYFDKPLIQLKPSITSNHNFTECCASELINDQCLSYCSLKNLASGSLKASSTISCVKYIPSIISCLTDGRNHLSCCEKQDVPDICLPFCAGNYNLTKVLDNVICFQYIAPILSCIAEGIETLPPQPKGLIAEPISSSQIRIEWQVPSNSYLIENYLVNVTKLHNFDENSETRKNNEFRQTFKVNSSENIFIIKNLKPFTMYEIVMLSVNKMGQSMPTVSIRALTQPSKKIKEKNLEVKESEANSYFKSPPDLRKCCKENGVQNETCLEALCDPSKAYQKNKHLLSCLNYVNVSFKCMNLQDSEDCCQQRGISPFCKPLCSLKPTLSIRQNICFFYFPTFLNCYVERYDVLPSPPIDLKLVSVQHTWCILKWNPPIEKGDSVLKYIIRWKESKNVYEEFNQAKSEFDTFYLLDNLKPGISYEVYVIAVNKFGSSQDSVRVLFQTIAIPSSLQIEAKMTSSQIAYNESACCHRAGISSMCAPLCSYQVKINDLLDLGPLCIDTHTVSILVRCTVGGRDHRNCCIRRGVTSNCLDLCAGRIKGSSSQISTQCAQDFGNIMLCMKEGVETLPGMPTQLHTYKVTKDSIALRWKKPAESESQNVNFTIRYSLVNNSVPKYPFIYHSTFNTSQTHAVLQNLTSGSIYNIYVIASNEFGSSLPSLVLLVETTKGNKTSKEEIKSTIGPPHAVEVIHQSYDTISLKWLSPLYISPDASLVYKVYYRPVVENEWQLVQVNFNNVDLFNLISNTEYAITTQAISQTGLESHFSETLLVFTDPIEPADVDTPLLLPDDFIVEGDNVTVVCTGRGLPTPMISVFINGLIVYKKISKKIFYTIPKFSRNITSIACYASNEVDGGGSSSVQKSIEISTRAPPLILTSKKHITVNRFDELKATCEISANPRPNVTWYKSDFREVPIELSLNTEISMSQSSMNPNIYLSTLSIKHINGSQAGKYICKAENDFGFAMISLEINVRIDSFRKNRIASCCAINGIIDECLGACSEKGIDIDFALNNPHCLNHLDELIFCARDGYDHTDCCIQFGVHHNCLIYCDGTKSPKRKEAFCLLSDAKLILICIRGLNSSFVEKEWIDDKNQNFNLIVSETNILKKASHHPFSLSLLLVLMIGLSVLLISSLTLFYYKVSKRKIDNGDDLYGFENQSYLRDKDLVDLGNRRFMNRLSSSKALPNKITGT